MERRQLKAESTTVGDILNVSRGARSVYEIPVHQREYTWERKHRETFFEDIETENTGYFLGSMVCVKSKNGQNDDNKFIVIDGQQRLVSISLIFAAIYAKLKEIEGESDETGKAVLADFKDTIKRRLILIEDGSDQRGKLRLRPSKQNYDLDAYGYIIGDLGISNAGKPANTKRHGTRRLAVGYKDFKGMLDKKLKEGLKELHPTSGEADNLSRQKEILQEFSNKLSDALIVEILPSSNTNAHTLFKALNDRGMPLTSLDLIKNEIFQVLGKEHSKLDKFLTEWNEILENLGQDFEVSKRFLRHHYMIQSIFNDKIFLKNGVVMRPRKVLPAGDLIGQYGAIIENILWREKRGIEMRAEEFLNEMHACSNYYKQITLEGIFSQSLNGKDGASSISQNLYAELKLLEQIEGVPSHLLLLYLFKRRDEKGDVQELHIEAAVKNLRQFFLCVRMINIMRTNRLDDLFWGLVKKLDKCAEHELVGIIKNALIGALLRPDEAFDENFYDKTYTEEEIIDSNIAGDFWKKITGKVYGDVTPTVRVILFYLQHYHDNVVRREEGIEGEKNQMIWIDRMDKELSKSRKKRAWSIEHVLPQQDPLEKSWINHIAPDCPEESREKEAKNIQEECLHKLGNLTLTVENEKLGVRAFEKKKEKLAKSEAKYLNGGIISQLEWRKEQIDTRTDKLARDFIKDFFDDSSFGKLVTPPKS